MAKESFGRFCIKTSVPQSECGQSSGHRVSAGRGCGAAPPSDGSGDSAPGGANGPGTGFFESSNPPPSHCESLQPLRVGRIKYEDSLDSCHFQSQSPFKQKLQRRRRHTLAGIPGLGDEEGRLPSDSADTNRREGGGGGKPVPIQRTAGIQQFEPSNDSGPFLFCAFPTLG